jgi:hypothetical protein
MGLEGSETLGEQLNTGYLLGQGRGEGFVGEWGAKQLEIFGTHDLDPWEQVGHQVNDGRVLIPDKE